MDPQAIEKFSAYTEKTNFCWNWKGFLGKRGAPIIRIGDPAKEYSPRQIALHLYGNNSNIKFSKPWCGNKLCVNPEHLIIDNISRFWAKVQKLSEPDGCWIWLAGEDKNGYGKFTYSENGKHVTTRAHRYSWELYTDRKVPSNIFLCHSCDNPRCVNPSHLWLGTTQDNTADRHAKGRSAKGEAQGSSKLTEAQVLEIRKMYTETKTYSAISAKYKISDGAIWCIVTNRSWKHLL